MEYLWDTGQYSNDTKLSRMVLGRLATANSE